MFTLFYTKENENINYNKLVAFWVQAVIPNSVMKKYINEIKSIDNRIQYNYFERRLSNTVKEKRGNEANIVMFSKLFTKGISLTPTIRV